jgi:Protein of unknown function (DUF1153)
VLTLQACDLVEALGGAAVQPVIGPYGELLTLDMLPPRQTRWTARRKAEVVAAVRGGALDPEFACDWYGISRDEFQSWDKALGCAGLRALKVTHLKRYRKIFDVQ